MKPKAFLLILFIGTIVMIAVMRWHGAPLITPVSKAGIVSLELAKTTEQSTIIINEWKQKNLIHQAITNTYIDFAFIIFYAFFLYTFCFFISLKQKPWAATISRTLAIAALTAGLCDVIENYFMLQMLEQSVTATYAFLSWLFAFIKFVLLAATVVWILMNLHILFRKRQ
jgi:tetrahydromethanopterin S-methyltransferase subunit C